MRATPTRLFAAAIFFLTGQSIAAPPVQPWHAKAPPLPQPTGVSISVSTEKELRRALETAQPGATIVIANGRYELHGPLPIRADGVTLRSASGDREKVVLDGGNIGEGIQITRCTGVTVADLTLENIRWNGIKIDSDTGVQRATIYNCILHNIWQRGVKGVAVPKEKRETGRPTGCAIRYCLFYNDRAKAFTDDPDDNPANFQGNYIAGIDVMFAAGWTISDNVFVGIRGRTGEGRGAIFLWQDSRGCVIERNVIVDCDAGICLGNSSRAESDQTHCTGFIVRNNFLTRVPENGILAVFTRDCRILHNTIYDPESTRRRLVRVVAENPGIRIANNLLIGPPLADESTAPFTADRNFATPQLAVADAATGNLRLTSAADGIAGKAAVLEDVKDDIDRHPRDTAPDLGAHEFRSRAAR